MEVYIDDKLVNSVKAKLHVDHLVESFQGLKDYKMKLNPTKCAYGVSSRKFLGFIVNSRGIEANPYKIKAVLNMQLITTQKVLFYTFINIGFEHFFYTIQPN